MSLILEALKKSDAERQRATATAPPEAVPSGDPAQRWLRISLLLAVIAVSIVVTWSLLKQSGNPPAQLQSDAPTTATEKRPLASSIEAVKETKQAVPQPVQREEPEPQSDPVPDPVVAAQQPQIETTLVDQPPVLAPAQPQWVVSEPVQQPTLVDLDLPPIETPAPIPVTRQSSSNSERPPLPTLAQLPSALQAEIGELTLNVLVFADQPADRFVLINLRRYQQGDRVNERLQVADIRADGAVLDFEGRQFLLDTRFP